MLVKELIPSLAFAVQVSRCDSSTHTKLQQDLRPAVTSSSNTGVPGVRTFGSIICWIGLCWCRDDKSTKLMAPGVCSASGSCCNTSVKCKQDKVIALH